MCAPASRWCSPRRRSRRRAVFPDLDQYQGLPLEYGRMETTVSDPSVWQQMGMRVGIPERRADQRARDIEHSRRAFRHLQRQVRRASVDGPAARGCAAGLRRIPQATRCARARRASSMRSTAAIPTSRRCRCTASSPRSRIRTTRRTCARRRTTTSTSRWTCRRSIRRSSRSCARRARSSTRSRSRTNSTAAPAIRAARTRRRRTGSPAAR